ncbi:MAG: hypothetical protein HY711_09555, partial [Candidatus Melainabacteria bacterium]|nr:hypothetical protein [Candidatus Melainabacteria bacterium]
MSLMWIERVEFIDFGNLSGEKIEFSKDKLNLVLAQNQTNMSVIPEAIWASLYTPAVRYEHGTVCLDIVYDRRLLRLVRDFSDKTLRIFDRDEPDVDITCEFLGKSGRTEVGEILTGMDKDLFKNVCFVDKHKVDETSLSESEDLSLLLQGVANCFETFTPSIAVQALEETLEHFPYEGTKFKVDQLIGQMQQRYEQLLSLEYFQLCLKAAECDSSLSKAEEHLERMTDLRQQLDSLSAFQGCSSPLVVRAEELWGKRQLLRNQLEIAKKEIESQEHHFMAQELENKERLGCPSGFTIDDAKELSLFAQSLQTAVAEMSQAKLRRDDELRRVREEGVNLNDLSGVRRALLNLDARDLDDAYAYNAMINSARDQISQCERSVWRARAILDQIGSERAIEYAKYKNMVLVLGFVALIGLMVFLTVLLGSGWQLTNPFVLGPLGGFFLLASALGYNCGKLILARKHRQKEFSEAQVEIDKQGVAGQGLHNK